jgi:predicted metal-binding membrane protein
MHGMESPWRLTPGQSWPAAAASFLGMWAAMTAAMMLPAAGPTLWRYGRALAGASGALRAAAQTAVAAAAYLAAWAAVGVVVFPLGAALGAALGGVRSAAPDAVVGAVVLAAGAYQSTAWRARQLADCRARPGRGGGRGGGWCAGTALARRCVPACAHLMAVCLVVDVMDVRLMAAVGALVAAERLAPGGERAARAVGVGLLVAGAALIVRAAASA